MQLIKDMEYRIKEIDRRNWVEILVDREMNHFILQFIYVPVYQLSSATFSHDKRLDIPL